MKEEEAGFKVTDKRLFRENGELREKLPAEEPPPPPKVEPPPRANAKQPLAEMAPGTPRQIDFPSYLLSYYTQGLMFLGEVPNPITGQIDQDLESAHQMIDILSMIQQKTKGNLTREEEQVLESILYELRMKFMAKTNRIKL